MGGVENLAERACILVLGCVVVDVFGFRSDRAGTRDGWGVTQSLGYGDSSSRYHG